jgi:hypothetical protein
MAALRRINAVRPLTPTNGFMWHYVASQSPFTTDRHTDGLYSIAGSTWDTIIKNSVATITDEAIICHFNLPETWLLVQQKALPVFIYVFHSFRCPYLSDIDYVFIRLL